MEDRHVRGDGQAEVRSYPVTEVRARRDEEGDPQKIQTHVAVFDEASEPLGPPDNQFIERIEPGALEPADDVTSEMNHDPNRVLGRLSAGTLDIEETDRGVRFDIDPPNTSYADDLVESIDRGDINAASFSFRVPDGGDSWEFRDDEPDLRTIHEATLFEGGPVVHPAYPQTDANLRGALESRQRWRREHEDEPVRRDDTPGVEVVGVPDGYDVVREWRDSRVFVALEKRQSRPEFDCTEDASPTWADGEWGRPNLSDHPEVEGDETWDELNAGERGSVAARFIEGTADADNYAALGYPVVNPDTGCLNRDGLLAARQRAAAEDDEEVEAIADALWDEHYEEDDDEENAMPRAEARLRLEKAR